MQSHPPNRPPSLHSPPPRQTSAWHRLIELAVFVLWSLNPSSLTALVALVDAWQNAREPGPADSGELVSVQLFPGQIGQDQFETIRDYWVRRSGLVWSELSPTRQAAIDQELRDRLEQALYPWTLASLAPKEPGYITSQIQQYEAAGVDLQPLYDAADERFLNAFPEMDGVDLTGTPFQFVWWGVFEDVSGTCES